MTSIAFHFNAPTKLSYTCRMLRKALREHATVAVLAPPPVLQRLDEVLWTFTPHDFLPHERVYPGDKAQTETPIVLCESAADTSGQAVMLNLLGSVPEGFDKFERVIEIVTLDESERASARQRWKHYSERGFEIIRHDVKTSPQIEIN